MPQWFQSRDIHRCEPFVILSILNCLILCTSVLSNIANHNYAQSS